MLHSVTRNNKTKSNRKVVYFSEPHIFLYKNSTTKIIRHLERNLLVSFQISNKAVIGHDWVRSYSPLKTVLAVKIKAEDQSTTKLSSQV